MLKLISILAETSKRGDRDLIIVPPSTFSTDATSSPMLKSVIVRAPSGGTPSTSVSSYISFMQMSILFFILYV